MWNLQIPRANQRCHHIRDASILRIWYPLGSWNQFFVDTKGKLHFFHPRWFPQSGANSTTLSSFCHFDFFYQSSFFFNRRIMTILCWFLPHIKTQISHRYTCVPFLLSLLLPDSTALGHRFSYCNIIIISWGSCWQGSQQGNTVPGHPWQKPLTLLCRVPAIPLSLSHSTLAVGSVVLSLIFSPCLAPGSLLSVAVHQWLLNLLIHVHFYFYHVTLILSLPGIHDSPSKPHFPLSHYNMY